MERILYLVSGLQQQAQIWVEEKLLLLLDGLAVLQISAAAPGSMGLLLSDEWLLRLTSREGSALELGWNEEEKPMKQWQVGWRVQQARMLRIQACCGLQLLMMRGAAAETETALMIVLAAVFAVLPTTMVLVEMGSR